MLNGTDGEYVKTPFSSFLFSHFFCILSVLFLAESLSQGEHSNTLLLNKPIRSSKGKFSTHLCVLSLHSPLFYYFYAHLCFSASRMTKYFHRRCKRLKNLHKKFQRSVKRVAYFSCTRSMFLFATLNGLDGDRRCKGKKLNHVYAQHILKL